MFSTQDWVDADPGCSLNDKLFNDCEDIANADATFEGSSCILNFIFLQYVQHWNLITQH